MSKVDAETRSRMMAAIRGKNTKPEMAVRKLLHSLGFRFRIHRRDLAGNPDIVLPKYRLAIFVHGCFWHQHPGCEYAVLPKSNARFWAEKLSANGVRDGVALSALHEEGWRTLIVWECSLKREATRRTLGARLQRTVLSKAAAFEIPSLRRP
jgi:DNA mismatch endonuclease, patch repair protein